MTDRCAAIDFGTNTARLLITTVQGGKLFPIYIERVIVRMGGGFCKITGLSRDAQQRGYECLKHFADIISNYEVDSVFAVATSAVRDAANQSEFLEKVVHHTGIELTVINGEQEGALTLRGVLSGIDTEYRHIMVLDVGGGSTEYTIAEDKRPHYVNSTPMGVVRVTEGFGSIEGMASRIETVIEQLLNHMKSGNVTLHPDTVLVATAGTATTLAAISQKMTTYDASKINNYILTVDEIRRIYETLLPLTPDERLSIPGMEKGREDLILCGILITLQTMAKFGFDSLLVSDYGLLEGVALSGGIYS